MIRTKGQRLFVSNCQPLLSASSLASCLGHSDWASMLNPPCIVRVIIKGPDQHFIKQQQVNTTISIASYTEYASLAITAGNPVKFGTPHARSRREVGSAKRIDAYSRKGVTPAPRIFGTSGKNMMTSTVFLGPKNTTFTHLLFVI